MAGLEPAKPRRRLVESQAAFPFAYIPGVFGRGGPIRTGMNPFDRMRGWNPLHCRYATPPCFEDAGKSARGKSRTFNRARFKLAASAVGLHAPEDDAGGESRTHKSRVLNAACLPFASLPPTVECWRRESNPQRAEWLTATSAPRVCPFRHPSESRRRDSNSQPLVPKTSAFAD